MSAVQQKAETLHEEILVLMRMLSPDCRNARSQDSLGLLRYANKHPPKQTNKETHTFPLDPARTRFRSLTTKIIFSKLCRMLFLPLVTMTTYIE